MGSIDRLPGVFDGFVELADIAVGGAEVHIWDGEVRLEFDGFLEVFNCGGGTTHFPVGDAYE